MYFSYFFTLRQQRRSLRCPAFAPIVHFGCDPLSAKRKKTSCRKLLLQWKTRGNSVVLLEVGVKP